MVAPRAVENKANRLADKQFCSGTCLWTTGGEAGDAGGDNGGKSRRARARENYPQVLQRFAHKPTAAPVSVERFFFPAKFLNLLLIRENLAEFPVAHSKCFHIVARMRGKTTLKKPDSL